MNPQRKPPPHPHAPDPLSSIKPLESTALLGSAGEVRILHEGRLYILRRTRHGKLILTA